MAKFRVNPSEAWRTLPKGEYTVMVTFATMKQPKQGEHPYVEVTMEVLEGEFKGETMVDRLSLSPKARPRIASFVCSCGLIKNVVNEEVEIDTDELIGRVLIVKGDVETFNGVGRFRPSTFRMHPDVAKAMAAQASKDAATSNSESSSKATNDPAATRRISRSI
jgi:hypothetical protein